MLLFGDSAFVLPFGCFPLAHLLQMCLSQLALKCFGAHLHLDLNQKFKDINGFGLWTSVCEEGEVAKRLINRGPATGCMIEM